MRLTQPQRAPAPMPVATGRPGHWQIRKGGPAVVAADVCGSFDRLRQSSASALQGLLYRADLATVALIRARRPRGGPGSAPVVGPRGTSPALWDRSEYAR